MEITNKKYRCDRCGRVVEQATNHYGPTWSFGRYNVCPDCPPWAKYPEFGGGTLWLCIDAPPLAVDKTETVWDLSAKNGKKDVDAGAMHAAFKNFESRFGDRLREGIRCSTTYRDYVSFNFFVRDLNVDDVEFVRAAVAKAFDGMEVVSVSVQPCREDCNVFVTACHRLVSAR